MSVNNIQYGGTHYQSEYQHWDWVEDINLGYLEGCATKYITRWRKKDGLIAIDKSHHYMSKVLERYQAPRQRFNTSILSPGNNRYRDAERWTLHFCISNHLDEIETKLIFGIAGWQTETDLRHLLINIRSFYHIAEKEQEL